MNGRDPRYLEVRNKALELFAREGFSRVSMRDLAAYMGIRAGSIYNHIESKEALLYELIEELYQQLLHGAILIGRRQVGPEVRLQALLVAHLRLHESMADHFRLAEYDLRCLGQAQQAQILALRQRYEAHFVQTVGQLTGSPVGPACCAGLRGVVSLLNQLPTWVGRNAPGLQDMALSMVQSVLRIAEHETPKAFAQLQ